MVLVLWILFFLWLISYINLRQIFHSPFLTLVFEKKSGKKYGNGEKHVIVRKGSRYRRFSEVVYCLSNEKCLWKCSYKEIGSRGGFPFDITVFVRYSLSDDDKRVSDTLGSWKKMGIEPVTSYKDVFKAQHKHEQHRNREGFSSEIKKIVQKSCDRYGITVKDIVVLHIEAGYLELLSVRASLRAQIVKWLKEQLELQRKEGWDEKEPVTIEDARKEIKKLLDTQSTILDGYTSYTPGSYKELVKRIREVTERMIDYVSVELRGKKIVGVMDFDRDIGKMLKG
jgi:hypothetical protein